MDKFWKWAVNESPGENQPENRTLYLDGAIADESWLDDDVTPEIFKEELFSGSGPITVWINSPGGDCVAASRIYTMLMDYPSDVTVKIDGIAASAASVVAMAGTEVLMSPTAMIMIHNPATIAAGDHGEMQKAIEMLSEVKESIINAYEIKTGLSRARLSHMMDEETWMNAKKAMELGFADGILEDDKTKADDAASYAFSTRTAQASLVNKLTEKAKLEHKDDSVWQGSVPAKQDGKDPALAEPGQIQAGSGNRRTDTQKMGRSVDELKARLQAIKNFM